MAASNSKSPECVKMIQQQLLLLLHAQKCQLRRLNGSQVDRCSVPYCELMISVLKHMETCRKGKQCTVPHCYSWRLILHHWFTCVRSDCIVCSPLNPAVNKKLYRNMIQSPETTSMNPVAMVPNEDPQWYLVLPCVVLTPCFTPFWGNQLLFYQFP
ncbi:hypothetical protein M514_09596 [Trichuris suis]|uniref:histone acetyltransferase n=1 Tax=Trichuris suis TaxID=68888 RepID=A0A085N862_9BILA|nr:hypothetical protein M513_09596 [Trichuris suis]KFD65658.1 hypothetical protein M514_09596 [Trichuris suis]KHJ48476.1 TAZ zinc finger [Trichuris suis]